MLLSGCKQAGPGKVDIKNDSLMAVVAERDSSLIHYIDTFNEIESNLDSVAVRQQIISMNTDKSHGELKGSKKEHINAEIAAINDLMDRNRKEMEGLTKKLQNSKYNNAALQKTIKTLNIQISQKDYELCELNLKLDELNTKVTKLNTTIDSLGEQNHLKAIVIDYQTKDLHTAFYIVGEKKDLLEEKIIDRKGGVLGLGRTSELSQNFDDSKFTKIEFTETSTIPINGEDIKVITNHPSDSYKLDKDEKEKGRVKNLVITNPVKFWSSSKYLVVVKK